MRRNFGQSYQAFSAGTEQTQVHPLAIRSMAELGTDITAQRSKTTTEFEGQDFDYIVTVCDHAAEVCPTFYGRGVRIHRSFADPSATLTTQAKMLCAFNACRDEIDSWLQDQFAP
ncbi:MAG: arsenate reductase [Halieaceae bacterium]|jgi:arsenate reductase